MNPEWNDMVVPVADRQRAEARIAELWPELHTEVRYNPVDRNLIGVISEFEVGSREQRNLAGMILGAWRKIMPQGPTWGTIDGHDHLFSAGAILLVGPATRCWRDDLDVRELWNRWGVWNTRHMVMSTQSPHTLEKGSASRWSTGIERFFEGAVAGVGTWGLSGECVRGTCGNPLWKYDGDGIAWCERHWNEKYPTVKVTTKGKAKRAGQEAMEM